MHTFTDNAGRVWTANLNVATLKRVRALAGVDLASAYANPAVQWIGLAVVCVVVPALVSWLVSEFMRKKGWISDGDYKLDGQQRLA